MPGDWSGILGFVILVVGPPAVCRHVSPPQMANECGKVQNLPEG